MLACQTPPTQNDSGSHVITSLTKSRGGRWSAVASLVLAPPLLLGIARILGWIGDGLTMPTLVGCGIAAAGGLLTGLAAERFLHRGRNGAEHLIGLAATTALGVLTIGYLYLVHIRGPMSSIGTLSRAVSQILIFVEFLTAQAAGVLLAVITGGKTDPQV
jgi:hypothetical protein